MVCSICNNTGKRGTSRYLDCHCGAAVERARVEGAATALTGLGESREDVWWNLYQMGEKARDEAFMSDVAKPCASITALDAQAIRWAVNKIDGAGLGQSQADQIMMERLRAMHLKF